MRISARRGAWTQRGREGDEGDGRNEDPDTARVTVLATRDMGVMRARTQQGVCERLSRALRFRQSGLTIFPFNELCNVISMSHLDRAP